MNLLIFLDLTDNQHAKISNFTLQGQNVQIFLSFTYNQGKIYLILPIIARWEHVYLVSIGIRLWPMSCACRTTGKIFSRQ